MKKRRYRRGGLIGAGLLSTLAVLVSACATAPTPVTETFTRPADAGFLISPLSGYSRSLSASEAEALRAAHRSLLAGKDPVAVAGIAENLLSLNPDLEPGRLLLAQSDFVRGQFQDSFDRASPLAEDAPEYLAAQLVAGRAAEKLERVREAFEIYLRAGPDSAVASQRARKLRPRAVEIAAKRTGDFLAKGRLEEAGAELARLEAWAPDELRTLELVAAHAAETGEADRELEAVKRLNADTPSVELSRRQAGLEMVAGDAGEGLRILEGLTERFPDDFELALELERAKFRWRLDLLPADVRSLFELPELTRADFAKLLFWLFPDVRYGRPTQGRIASDILDHPFRQEVARVVNLDLMRLDSTLHLFHPDRSLTRQDGLKSVLRVLVGRNPSPACFGTDDPRAGMSVERLCGLAARCGLIEEALECLPEATGSGRFVEAIGFAALDVLGKE